MSKKLFRAILVPYEYLFSLFNNWQTIPNSVEKVFLVNVKKYRGKEYTLKDNTIIKKGDLVAELHVNNTHVIDLDNSITNLYRLMDYEFEMMAKALNNEYSNIKAFYCETVLYALVSRKGFQTFSLPNNLATKIKGFWFRTLKTAFSTNKTGNKNRKPRICWISANRLKEKYLAE